MAAGTYGVLAESADTTMNGGLASVLYAATDGFDLYNAAATVTLKDAAGTVIATASIPAPEAAAAQALDPAYVNVANGGADASHWCTAGTAGYFEGLGTPGTANEACPCNRRPGRR